MKAQAESGYFEALDDLLCEAGQAQPCLVLDRDRLDANIALARSRAQVPVRVVAKSLACLPLIDRAARGLGANGLMTFSAAMLQELLTARPEAQHLLGKPLPITAAAQVLERHSHAAEQVIWLIDTAERAAQYAALAEARGLVLRVALEVDVGLHRGGVRPEDMPTALAQLRGVAALSAEGVMGYEPHLPKLPGPFKPAARAQVDAVLRAASDAGLPLINTGGSMTFADYGPAQGVSEVALGSVLVKPTDFDMGSTEGFQPALFIAAPILKYLPGNPMPGPAWISRLMGRARKADLAIYGGYWKARPVHPAGFGYSGVFGHSSNQEIWSGPPLAASPVDRFAFLRPAQSEAILPEFGRLIVVSQGAVVDTWPCLPVQQ